MSKEANPTQESRLCKPERIDPDELYMDAVKQGIGYSEPYRLAEYLSEDVSAVRVNGVDVVSVNFEHGRVIDPFLGDYIRSPRTKVVVPEYFYPEVSRNTSSRGIRRLAR